MKEQTFLSSCRYCYTLWLYAQSYSILPWAKLRCKHFVYLVVSILLGISPASEVYKPMFRNSVSVPSSWAFLLAQDDGTNTEFRNVSLYNSDAGEITKRILTTFRTW